MSELDQALLRFQRGCLEYGQDSSNHGPMAAEALEMLGHGALIPALTDVYTPRLGVFALGQVIEPDATDDALGNGEDGDWVATFLDRIETSSWSATVQEWLPRLLPGMFAASGQGLLRTAHALRAVRRLETRPRILEVAYGLGYWASRFQTLPGSPASHPATGFGAVEWLESLTPLLASRDSGSGLEWAESAAAIDLQSVEIEAQISSLCSFGARIYLGNARDRVITSRCVTLPSAVRLLSDELDSTDLRRAIGFVTQVLAAAWLNSSNPAPPFEGGPQDDEVLRLSQEEPEIRYVAACSAEGNAIMLAEACLREDRLRSDRHLRLAAADAALRIGVSAGSRGA